MGFQSPAGRNYRLEGFVSKYSFIFCATSRCLLSYGQKIVLDSSTVGLRGKTVSSTFKQAMLPDSVKFGY